MIAGIMLSSFSLSATGLYGFAGDEKREGADVPVMTLKECMRYAVENSTQMVSARANSADKRISRRDAVLQAFTPNISGSSYGYFNFGRAVDPETNTYTSTTSFNNGYGVSGSLALFNGFEAVNNLKITSTAIKMGLSEEQQTVDRICLATMEAYYNVLYYKELTSIVESQVETAKNSLNKVKQEESLGVKSYADVVQLEADLANREYQAVNTRNMYEDALITLKDLMFWPVNSPLDIEPLDMERQQEQVSIADTSGMLDMARNNMPSVIIAKGERDNAKLALNTARWKVFPSLNLSGGWSTSYYTYPGSNDYKTASFKRQFRDNGGEYVQFSLSIPIYGRLLRRSEIARKRNAYIRANAAYEQKLQEVDAEVARAVNDCNGAGLAYLHAERNAAVSQEAYMLNNKKFEQGLISSIEFKTASEAYLQAMAERLNAVLKYYIKQSVVKYYQGVPYIEQ